MKPQSLIKKLVIAGAMLSIIIPLFLLLLWVITDRWAWPNLLPTEYGLRAIEHIFAPYNDVFSVLLRSVGIAIAVTILTLLATLPAVKALTFYPIKLKRLWYALIWAPLLVPTTAIGMGVHRQIIKLGLANTIEGVILVQLIVTIPYGMLMIQEIYEIVGEKLEIQARMLGASKWQTLRLVILPTLMPGVMVASIFIFTISFGQYFLTFLIGGGQVVTFPMLMFPFITQGDRSLSAVYSLLFVGTLLISIYIFEKIIKKKYKLYHQYFG